MCTWRMKYNVDITTFSDLTVRSVTCIEQRQCYETVNLQFLSSKRNLTVPSLAENRKIEESLLVKRKIYS